MDIALARHIEGAYLGRRHAVDDEALLEVTQLIIVRLIDNVSLLNLLIFAILAGGNLRAICLDGRGCDGWIGT